MALDRGRAHGRGGQSNDASLLVARIADIDAVAIAQRVDRAQVHLVLRGRVGAVGVHQLERATCVLEDLHGGINLLDRAHACGNESVLLLFRDELEHIHVREQRGGDLVVLEIVLAQEDLGVRVPGGREPVDVELAAVAVDLVIVCLGEFETHLLFALGRAPRALARLVQVFLGVDLLDGPLLELDRVAAAFLGARDQLACDVEVAVMIDADFGDDVDRMHGLSAGRQRWRRWHSGRPPPWQGARPASRPNRCRTAGSLRSRVEKRPGWR